MSNTHYLSTAQLNKKRETLICEYNKSYINGDSQAVLNKKKDNILKFKKDLLKGIAIVSGNVNQNQLSLDNVIKSKLNISDEYRKKLKENISKHLSGTELKKNIYEENTKLTISLIYYILGTGFMGYYIFKLLKK